MSKLVAAIAATAALIVVSASAFSFMPLRHHGGGGGGGSAHPVITYGTPSPSIPDTTPTGTALSTVTLTMSDASPFTGSVGFGGTYSNGGGMCALTGSGTSYSLNLGPGGPQIFAFGSGTLTTSEGTWSFSGSEILLNGGSVGGGSFADSMQITQGSLYALNSGTWFLRTGGNFVVYGSTAPLPLPPGTSTQHCTVQAIQGGTTNADIAINVTTGSTPAMAAAAGFTTQVLDADFTSPAYSNPATFVDNCGTGLTGPHFVWAHFLSATRMNCASDVTVIPDPDDPTGSPQVLSVSCPPSEGCARQATGGNIQWPHVLWQLSEPCNTFTAGCMPIEYYFELVFRIPTAGWDQSSGAAHVNHYWTGRNSDPSGGIPYPNVYMETDPFETVGPPSTNCAAQGIPLAPCYTQGGVENSNDPQVVTTPQGEFGQGTTTDFQNYHTLAALVTSDGSSVIWECVFVDGALTNPSGTTQCISMTSQPSFSPGGYLQHDNGFTTEFDLFGTGNPVVPIQVLYKSLKIWECPNYQTATCSGTLITHWP